MNTITRSILLATCATLATTLQAQQAPDERPGQTAQLPAPTTEVGITQHENQTVSAEGSDFQLTFDAAGVAIDTANGVDGTPRLSLQYLGSQRGFHGTPATTDVPPQLAGDRVRYLRGDVVETYEIGSRGYEQSFHIAQRPAGEGDLVLTLGVSGNVTADRRKADHQAIEFRHNGAGVIRYGEAFVFERGGERLPIATRYDGFSRLELIVPDEFVRTATFPITVDPAVGPVLIAATATWNDTNPDSAHNAICNRYMLAWERTFTTGTPKGIRTQLFDVDGNALTSFISVTSSSDSTNPAIAYCNAVSPSAFLVVYRNGGAIWGRLMSASNGAALAPQFQISIPAAGEVDDKPTVSGPGNGAMMIAWQRTRAGETEAREVVMRDIYFPNPATPNVVNLNIEHDLWSTTSGYVNNVRLARSDVSMTLGGVAGYANRIAFDRWWTSPAPGDWDIYTGSFHLSTTGALTIIDPIGTAPFANAIGDNELGCDIGVRADNHSTGANLQYCLAWEDEQDVHAAMYDELGVIGAEIIVDDNPNEYEGMPAVGAGKCEFTIAYGVIVPPAEFAVAIYGARVLMDGTVAINRRLIDDPGGPYQADIAASSRPVTNTVPWPRNTSLITWWGQTGPAGGLNDVRARFFEPVAPYENPFGSPCPGPLGELPTIGTANGPAYAGNQAFELTITNAPANSLAALIFGNVLLTAPIPGAPGCELYMGLPPIMILPTVTNGAGNGSVNLPIPCSIPHGSTLAFQWGVYTPGHNAFGWISSDDVDISWSHF